MADTKGPARLRLRLRLHLRRVVRAMVLDLKRQKFVDGLQRFPVVSHNPHLPAPVGGLEGVVDRYMLLLHHRNSRRDTVMNEHRNIEVVVAEHRGNVGQMHPNLVPRSVIPIGLDVDFDDASVGKKREAMDRGFVGETHRMIATIVNACRVIIGLLMLIVHGAPHARLGLYSCGQA